jgi:shikimate dehydrogenase
MEVHSLDILNLKAPPGKRLVVLGDPIAHSLSPAMHNAALKEMAVDNPELAECSYEAVHVPAPELGRALRILDTAGVVGINLTIPHKVDVLGLIAEVDPLSRSMGAVNTLIATPGGYRGTNTDGFGITQAIKESFNRDLSGEDVWLFGAGGAARGIIVACLEQGAVRVTVVNRSPERLAEFQQALESQSLDRLDCVRFVTSAEVVDDASEQAVLINATSLGLKETDPSPIPVSFLTKGRVVYDTTYGMENELALDCQSMGIPYADGLSMLIWQGVRSLEIWTNKTVPAEAMRVAALEELKKRKSNG